MTESKVAGTNRIALVKLQLQVVKEIFIFCDSVRHDVTISGAGLAKMVQKCKNCLKIVSKCCKYSK